MALENNISYCTLKRNGKLLVFNFSVKLHIFFYQNTIITYKYFFSFIEYTFFPGVKTCFHSLFISCNVVSIGLCLILHMYFRAAVLSLGMHVWKQKQKYEEKGKIPEDHFYTHRFSLFRCTRKCVQGDKSMQTPLILWRLRQFCSFHGSNLADRSVKAVANERKAGSHLCKM